MANVKPHESVVSLPPLLPARNASTRDQGEAIFKKLQRLRDKIRNNDPQGFYLAKKVDEVNVDGIDLQDIFSKLRQRGLGILTGEIEDLCQDATVSSDNKMSLDAVFD